MELIIKHFKELSPSELYEIIKLRVNVFVVEQNCPYHELDDKDQNAYHIFYRDENGIAAYLRVLDRGVSFDEPALGRIVTARRGLGLGKAVVEQGKRFVKEKFSADRIKIEAQTYAKGFYEKSGFRQCSEEFLEDGIPHILMICEL